MSYYYDIQDDLKKYPDCWCYLIVGGRNTGKTYSTLKDARNSSKGFIFIKRTNLDVNNLCAGGHVHNKNIAGMKEYFAAYFLERPAATPAVTVAPEREIPGMTAMH